MCPRQQLVDQTPPPLTARSGRQGSDQTVAPMPRWHHSRYDAAQTGRQHTVIVQVAPRWWSTRGTLSDQPRRQVVNTFPARLTSEPHTKPPTTRLLPGLRQG